MPFRMTRIVKMTTESLLAIFALEIEPLPFRARMREIVTVQPRSVGVLFFTKATLKFLLSMPRHVSVQRLPRIETLLANVTVERFRIRMRQRMRIQR